MKPMWYAGAAVLVALAAWSAPAPAQDGVGRFDQIRECRGPGGGRVISDPTEKVQTSPADAERFASVGPRSPLPANHQIRVERLAAARVRVARSAHRGTLVFLPELCETPAGRVFPADQLGRGITDALYSVETDAGSPEDLNVSIRRGALVANWTHGRMIVEAAQARFFVKGTEFTVVVDSTGNSAGVFLLSGEIVFLAPTGLAVQPGQWVTWQAGAPPTQQPLDEPAQRLAREVTRDVSRRMFWSPLQRLAFSPWFQIGAGAVALVAAGAVVMDGDDAYDPPERRQRSGTVVVRFPS